MSNDITVNSSSNILNDMSSDDLQQFVTVEISGQLFGISVLSVREILSPNQLSKIPLAPKEILGSLNLRGRIITTVDIRHILKMSISEEDDLSKKMSLVVEGEDELYNMVVDKIGEVMTIPVANILSNPDNLESKWHNVALGVCMLEGNLLIILDINKLINMTANRDNKIVE